jgi:hypothetical protein
MWICPKCNKKNLELLKVPDFNDLFSCITQGCGFEIEIPTNDGETYPETYFKEKMADKRKGRTKIELIFEEGIAMFGKDKILSFSPDKEELKAVISNHKTSTNHEIWECYNIALKVQKKINTYKFIKSNSLIKRLSDFLKTNKVWKLISKGKLSEALNNKQFDIVWDICLSQAKRLDEQLKRFGV